MIVIRAAAARGRSVRDGVERRHAFSSGDYHDAGWSGWGALRVLDEVTIAPGAALGLQRRANMEILSLVIDGALLHRDADGVAQRVESGGLQWIGAGHGTDVDEVNASPTAPLRLLQAWIQPRRVNAPSSRAQRAAPSPLRGDWTTLASPDGERGSVAIRQHAWLRLASLEAGDRIDLPHDPARRQWMQVLHGSVVAGGRTLVAGDALGTVDESGVLEIAAAGDGSAALLAFDLPS